MNNWDELKKAAEYAQDFDNFADEAEEMRALSKFYDEVDPYQVLALIAENEHLTKQLHMMVRQCLPLEAMEGMPGWSEVVEAHKAIEQRDQARAEVDALRKDAERYRRLRSFHWNDSPLAVVRDPRRQVKLGADCPSGDILDTVIDAAIKGKE